MNTENETVRKEPKQRESHTAAREITVVNELGLHARPAAEFVRCAGRFRSEVSLIKEGRRFSAASMMEVLLADMECGQVAIVEAQGPDADAAVEALADLVQNLRD